MHQVWERYSSFDLPAAYDNFFLPKLEGVQKKITAIASKGSHNDIVLFQSQLLFFCVKNKYLQILREKAVESVTALFEEEKKTHVLRPIPVCPRQMSEQGWNPLG